ncbi:coiled-coil domain-containing protein 18 [Discoglossus pictus]
MESSLPAHRIQKEEQFAASVNKLRSKSRQAEISLQSLEDQISSDSSSEHSLSRAPLGLTLKDLEKPNQSEGEENPLSSKNNMALSGRDSMRRSRDKLLSATGDGFRNMEQENMQLRERLNSLQEQNKNLVSQNCSLMSKMETVQAELKKSNSRVRFFESAFGARTSRIPDLEENVVILEAELEAQEKALRNAEDQLEQSQHAVTEKEQVLQKVKEDLKKLKMELYERSKQCKRAEKQRNEALLSAEDLTRAFQQYKKNVAEKLEKAQAEGDLANKNLTNCEKEKEAVQEKCKVLETELEKTRDHLRNILSEKSSRSDRHLCLENKNAELISLLTQSNQRILRLESELGNKEKVLKENLELLHENKELKFHLAEQPEQNETEECGAQLDSIKAMSDLQEETIEASSSIRLLIADLRKKLSIKETENRELQVRLMSINVPVNNRDENRHERASLLELEEEPVKLTPNQTEMETYLQMELTCKQLQTDKEKLTERLKELQGKLSKANTEAMNTKLSMAQRTSQFQVIQEELLEKASKTSSLEQEIAKKSWKISTLQKQLEDVTAAHLSSTSRNVELEQELMDCREQIIHLEDNISKEHEEVLIAFETSKSIQQDQNKELRKQIDHLQCQMEMKSLHISEQDHAIQALQQEILLKQRQLESMDQIVAGAKRELDLQTKTTSEAMRKLENQFAEETLKVRHLESALAVCKEELVLYLHQLEDNRESFEIQVKKKSEELQRLQEELKFRNVSLQETSEENVRLQQTLQQQQQMLQQGTARIGELEDTQAELEKQIFKLEHRAQKQRSATDEELMRTEGKLHAARQELEMKTQQVQELNSALGQLKCEVNQNKEKVTKMEEELESRRQDLETKNNKLNHLEMTLQQTQSDLDKKIHLVGVLEERLQRTEKDIQRKEELESEMRTIQEELEDKGRHLLELQDMVSQTNLSLEEKKTIIQDLTEELRACKSELEDRDHELLDMDQALKDRNWELKQRAAQLTQLDMSIREHKGEMEQKIIRLESALEKSQLEAKDRINQVTSLDEKLQLARDQLCVKEFDLLQKDQVINHLKKDIERKQVLVTEMEKSMKEQERRISEQHQEGKDLQQQVRLAREQMQFAHIELSETRQQLAEAQKESERLTLKLEETNRLYRKKQEQMNKELEEAQHTVCSIKTELQARNEVIKATNEVLVLKESELTRLKARISGYERRLGLIQPQSSKALPPESFSETNPLDSSKHFQFSDYKEFGIRRSLSATDLSLEDLSSLDLPKSMMEDIRNVLLPDSTPTSNNESNVPRFSSDSFNDSSFNPLPYTVDNCDAASDSADLDTLSGMLKYIKKKMNKSAASHPSQEYVG